MDSNTLVWAFEAEQHGYVLGKIVDIGGKDTLTVKTLPQPVQEAAALHIDEDRILTLSSKQVFLADPDTMKHYADNCSLMYLNPGTLLHNLKLRFYRDLIYTFVSNILIAINPYTQIRDLYSEDAIKSYIGSSLGQRPPHTFAIAEKAYRDLKSFKRNQSIIISGDSGSGKTECTKHVIKYLTHAYGKAVGLLETRIMDSNPILESFGNAKTARNTNSSRFGKFVEIYFDDKDMVTGGYISHYLLERSRICSQGSEDRNYHIFYQLCIGANPPLKRDFHLTHALDYKILRKDKLSYFLSPESIQHLRSTDPSTLQILLDRGTNLYSSGDVLIDDFKDFQRTDTCLSDIGMGQDDRKAIYAILAGILHLGNVEFQKSNDPKNDGCEVSQGTKQTLLFAASLLGLDDRELQFGLTKRMISSRMAKGTIIQIPLKAQESMIYRDSLCKAIYTKLFDRINTIINDSIPYNNSKKYIGVLDIAGFEYFVDNSFEQFCINYCNERIQNYFNHVVLIQEQELYRKEGLNIKHVPIKDDKDVIELLDAKKVGIFDILDEENRLTSPSARHFTQTVHHAQHNNRNLKCPRKSTVAKQHKQMLDEEGFIIKHYAAEVCYNTREFIAKNNDNLHISLVALIQESLNPLIGALFAPSSSPVSQNGSHHAMHNGSGNNGDKKDSSKSRNQYAKGKLTALSVSGNFRNQLKALFDKMGGSNTNFIKCIKPNACMAKLRFEGRSIIDQLEASGTIEVLTLMEHGYPSRVSAAHFYQRYKTFLPAELGNMDPRLFCKFLFKSIGLRDDDFKFGTSRIFFRSGKFAEFDRLIQNDPQGIQTLITGLRAYILRARWKRAQWCSLYVIKVSQKIRWKHKAAITCQKNIRMYLAKLKFQQRYRSYIGLRKLQHLLNHTQESLAQLPKNQSEILLTDLNSIETKLNAQISQLRNPHFMPNHRSGEDNTLSSLAQKLATIKEESLKVIACHEKHNDSEEKSNVEHVSEAVGTCTINENQDIPGKNGIGQLISNQESKKFLYDLSGWKYTELRDTINTSCDIALLESCREEFHRRLKVYHEWKAQNHYRYDTAGDYSTYSLNRLPVHLKASRVEEPATLEDQLRFSDNKHRFFRVPFWQNSSIGILCNKGWWFAHFRGNWIVRQMEIYDTREPMLFVAGKDDMQMCELSLMETGLPNTPGAEIKMKEFDNQWLKQGGQPYKYIN